MKKRKPRPSDPPEKTAAGPGFRRQSRFHPRILDDLRHWIQTEPRMADRIIQLVEATLRDPFTGIGKPEPLRGEHGIWSRRIDGEHRLTNLVAAEYVEFLQARWHYSKW